MPRPLTLEETRDVMAHRGHSLSKTRIYQLEKQALAKLRQHPAFRELALDIGLKLKEESNGHRSCKG